jgi:hypothetical protein
MAKAMKRLRGAKVTKRPPKAMEHLPVAKSIKLRSGAKPTGGYTGAKAMKYLPIGYGVYMVMYVARECVTQDQMVNHYETIMKPWLKKHKVTKVRCWIARHGGLLSMILQVNDYSGDWSEIEDIHELYRSDSKRWLMRAQLWSEDDL